ncbi:hypothetical protein BDQ17DRAFT_688424 [Cyathus striatus]|nr:hypothetical protein BDQ17DRAFT_688424 [Cyathus striatus]
MDHPIIHRRRHSKPLRYYTRFLLLFLCATHPRPPFLVNSIVSGAMSDVGRPSLVTISPASEANSENGPLKDMFLDAMLPPGLYDNATMINVSTRPPPLPISTLLIINYTFM